MVRFNNAVLSWSKFRRHRSQGGVLYKNSQFFDQYLALYQTQYKIGPWLLLNGNSKSYAID